MLKTLDISFKARNTVNAIVGVGWFFDAVGEKLQSFHRSLLFIFDGSLGPIPPTALSLKL